MEVGQTVWLSLSKKPDRARVLYIGKDGNATIVSSDDTVWTPCKTRIFETAAECAESIKKSLRTDIARMRREITEKESMLDAAIDAMIALDRRSFR